MLLLIKFDKKLQNLFTYALQTQQKTSTKVELMQIIVRG